MYVINGPLGQTHSPQVAIVSNLQFVMFSDIMKSWDDTTYENYYL